MALEYSLRQFAFGIKDYLLAKSAISWRKRSFLSVRRKGLLKFPMLFAIFRRCQAKFLFEIASKMTFVADTHFDADLLNLKKGTFQ